MPKKTKIILSGACGKMGRVVADCVSSRAECEIVAGIDLKGECYADFPIYKTPFEFTGEADVIIDFSHPSALGNLLSGTARINIPTVLATTGYGEEEISEIKRISKQIPIFFSPNMSLGVNLLAELARKTADILDGQFDIEIIEKHHNQKIDAPSGTALFLADTINSVLDSPHEYIYDRHTQRNKRAKEEIGIHTVRGGTIPGEHEIIFAGRDEVITLSHSALSKDVFAVGAVNAALFITGQQPGLYSMQDLINNQ